MPSIHRLSSKRVATLARPGRHCDGGGLYLIVDARGAKRWAFRYRWRHPGASGAGRLREMGLGSFSSVPLAKARKKAADARSTLADGLDPIGARRLRTETPTFGTLADEYLETRSHELRSSSSVARLKLSLEDYAKPLRSLQVDQITVDDVVAALKPRWTERPEISQKARSAIEAVLDAAKARGLRSGENPASWGGNLASLLPRRSHLDRRHHAALPYPAVPAFVAHLRARDTVVAWALEFLILTAARSGEALGARESEFDLANEVWTIPAGRMKAGIEHRVPLTPRAVELVKKTALMRRNGLVFPSRRGKPFSDSTFAHGLLDPWTKAGELGGTPRPAITTHGFRSSFRDWAGETTDFPREVAEAALAHAVGDRTERAYRRGDALEKRRKLMDEWAAFCGSQVHEGV